MPPIFTLQFDAAALDLILTALADRPFRQVGGLIGEIQKQAQEQIAKAEASATNGPAQKSAVGKVAQAAQAA